MNLFIDTSSNYLILVLWKNNTIISSFYVDANKKHTETAVKNIQKFLNNNKICPKNIKNLYCINGPGSFTGIRVCLTIIKAWKVVFPKINLYAGSSFCIQNKNIKYLSATNTEVYNKKFELEKKENINSNLIGYQNIEEIILNIPQNINKLNKINDLKDLLPNYVKGFI